MAAVFAHREVRTAPPATKPRGAGATQCGAIAASDVLTSPLPHPAPLCEPTKEETDPSWGEDDIEALRNALFDTETEHVPPPQLGPPQVRRVAMAHSNTPVTTASGNAHTRDEPFDAPASVAAPLSKFVGGVPITRSRPPPKAKGVAHREQQLRKLNRELAKMDSQMHPDMPRAHTKFRDKDRDEKWATLRTHQTQRVTGLYVANGRGECGQSGLITPQDAVLVDALCTRAAHQAANTPRSRGLETGSAALWAIALVQEVYSRRHGWIVEDEQLQFRLSFASMEQVCCQTQGDATFLPERHVDEVKEMCKTSAEREHGVQRKLCSHSFGSHEQILAKLDCLDKLLKASDPNGVGLHGEIKRKLPPALMRAPKPVAGSLGECKALILQRHSLFGDGTAR